MIYLENTKENRAVKDVVSTMAIEDMYLDKEFVDELLKVSHGEKSSDVLREEIVSRYSG